MPSRHTLVLLQHNVTMINQASLLFDIVFARFGLIYWIWFVPNFISPRIILIVRSLSVIVVCYTYVLNSSLQRNVQIMNTSDKSNQLFSRASLHYYYYPKNELLEKKKSKINENSYPPERARDSSKNIKRNRGNSFNRAIIHNTIKNRTRNYKERSI